MACRKPKVVVIGAGAVGTTYMYALLQTGMAEEIALIDLDANRVEGEIMDLSHGLPFLAPVRIKAGTYEDCADASLIVITAGAKQAPGQSRADLIRVNAGIVRAICTQIAQQASDAVVLMVTNPVDTLTHVALESLGWPRQRVIGSGTVLDSARFKYMLSRHCGIDPRNVHAYIIGEHGDSEVAAWSLSHIGGVGISDYCRICGVCNSGLYHKQIAEQVRDSAYHIIDYKGSTYYGIGLSLVRITGAVLRNENSVLTVSSLLKGEYGIHDVCLSVPCVVGEHGVVRIIDAKLAPEEQEALQRSAEAIAGNRP
ncbi:MAG: L-lactate dehydrogenase [Phycisphaerae bacterium]|nr:L-lactate dehydrogenase [Phycisphaerae bacterium]